MGTNFRGQVFRICALVLAWLWARPEGLALAQPSLCDRDPVCQAQLDLALQAESGQRYEEALRAFRAAHQRQPSPRLAANIGRTLHKLGRYGDALGWYRKAGRDASASADVPLQQELRKFVADTRLAMEPFRTQPVLMRPLVQIQPAKINLTPINNLSVRLDTTQYLVDRPTKPLYKHPLLWTVGTILLAGAIGGAAAAWPRPWSNPEQIPSSKIFSLMIGGLK